MTALQQFPVRRNQGRYEPEIDDLLLAEVAVRIQLTPTDHRKAVERYETIGRFLENRADLPDPVDGIFPQGSMAIGATVAARASEEFDIDLVADLGVGRYWQSLTAAQVRVMSYDRSPVD